MEGYMGHPKFLILDPDREITLIILDDNVDKKNSRLTFKKKTHKTNISLCPHCEADIIKSRFEILEL